MRRSRAWGVGAALVLGLGAAAGWAGEGAGARDEKPNKSWFGSWFGKKEKEADQKAARAKEAAAAEDEAPRQSVVEQAAAQRKREEAVLMRRLEVCDRLREVAVRANDLALEQRAEELSKRAWAAYSQKTAHLPTAQARVDADDVVLERHLSTASPSTIREAGKTFTVTDTERGRKAALKD